MTSSPIYSSRYTNTNIQKLIRQLASQTQQHQSNRIARIKRDRRTHQSCCQMMERHKQKQINDFNNKTFHNGKLFQQNLRSVPYVYLSKHKQDGLIIPDRAFAKGKAAKRLFIKMKDTSIYSFQAPQSEKMKKHLLQTQKQRTIVGRKLQELQRIIDNQDGKTKAEKNKWFLLNRKTFRPPSNMSDLFSQVDPMLQPKDLQRVQFKKISLTRTYSRQNKWTPSSKTMGNFFCASATSGNSFYKTSSQFKKKTYA